MTEHLCTVMSICLNLGHYSDFMSQDCSGNEARENLAIILLPPRVFSESSKVSKGEAKIYISLPTV